MSKSKFTAYQDPAYSRMADQNWLLIYTHHDGSEMEWHHTKGLAKKALLSIDRPLVGQALILKLDSIAVLEVKLTPAGGA